MRSEPTGHQREKKSYSGELLTAADHCKKKSYDHVTPINLLLLTSSLYLLHIGVSLSISIAQTISIQKHAFGVWQKQSYLLVEMSLLLK